MTTEAWGATPDRTYGLNKCSFVKTSPVSALRLIKGS